MQDITDNSPGQAPASRWSSRSLASRFHHAVFYWGIRLAGHAGGYFLLFFVITWFTLVPSVRKRGMHYITRRFPSAGGLARLGHTWKLQWRFGQCLVDRAAAGLGGAFSLGDSGRESIEALAAEGKGVILLAAHVGCWQMAPAVFAERSRLPVSALVHKDAADVDKQAFEHAGTRAPYGVIPTTDGPFAAMELAARLGRGEAVCLMGDRAYARREPVVWTPFLGALAPLPILAYRLASVTGAPIAVVLPFRSGAGKGTFLPARVIRVPAGLGKTPAAYARAAGEFSAALEAFVMDHPYQFFNFFNFWE